MFGNSSTENEVSPRSESRLLQRFVVESSSGKHFPFLDGVRGLAVLMVLLFHSWNSAGAPKYGKHVANLLAVCFTGVDLFFILSGFLLVQAWIRNDFAGKPPPNLREYFRRRWYRIAPGYYCALILWVLLFIPMMTPSALFYSAKGVAVFAVHALMLNNLLPIAGQYNPTWWTIPVETLFYATLPFTAHLFLRNRSFIGILFSLLISVGWTLFYLHPPQVVVAALFAFLRACLGGIVPPDVIRNSTVSILVNQLPTYCVVFALGMALANLYVRKQSGLAQTRFWSIALGQKLAAVYFMSGWLVTIVSMNHFGHHILKGKMVNLVSVSALTSLGFTLIMAGLLFGPAWTRLIFSFPTLRLLGLVGYSAYLWHIPMIFVATRIPVFAALSPAQRFPAMFIFAATATIGIASLFYLTVEKPFLLASRRRKHVFGKTDA